MNGQTMNVLVSSKSNDWATPQYLFDQLDAEFHFTLDPCASDENHKCAKYYTEEQDGLAQNWGGETVFCNPPYGKDIGKWAAKCSEEAEKGAVVVLLVFAHTDTKWLHEYVKDKAEIRFIKGRLKFGNAKHNAPWPSIIAVYKRGEI